MTTVARLFWVLVSIITGGAGLVLILCGLAKLNRKPRRRP